MNADDRVRYEHPRGHDTPFALHFPAIGVSPGSSWYDTVDIPTAVYTVFFTDLTVVLIG